MVTGRAYRNKEEISVEEGVLLKEFIESKRDAFYKKCMESAQGMTMEIHFVDQAKMIKTGMTLFRG